MCLYLPEDEHPYTALQLRQTPADEGHPHQLSESIARAQLDSDDAHLP